MRSAVSDVTEIRSVLKALGTRPDHEAVDTARFKLSELSAHSSRGSEEFNEDCKMYKAVITLDEMHGAYEKMLGEAERRLERIYEAAVSEEGDNFIEEEDGGKNVEEAEEMNEEVARILKEAESRKGIERVDLSERKLRTLPEAFGRLASLVVLNLSNNQLEVVDRVGCQFQQTDLLANKYRLRTSESERLSIQYNKFRSVPTSIGGMKSLKLLDVHFNELRGLPHFFGKLINLEIRNLSSNFNDLTELPDNISDLISLKELDLSNNQIHTLPFTFGQLFNLTKLNLDQSQYLQRRLLTKELKL